MPESKFKERLWAKGPVNWHLVDEDVSLGRGLCGVPIYQTPPQTYRGDAIPPETSCGRVCKKCRAIITGDYDYIAGRWRRKPQSETRQPARVLFKPKETA